MKQSQRLRLGRAESMLKVGLPTLAQYLVEQGYDVDPEPNQKISEEQFRLLLLKFSITKKFTIESAADRPGITVTRLVDLLEARGVAIRRPYKPEDEVTGSEYGLATNYLSLLEYFDLDIEENKLFKKAEPESGVHGLEDIDGEFYATHFHLKTAIAKGKMKEILSKIRSRHLYGKAQHDNTDFDRWPSVQYKGDSFSIKKYKLTWLLSLIESNNSEEKTNTRKELQTGIGFHNFRRFEDLPKVIFSLITYLVGKNNSGKSTLVKGLLLCLDYIKNQRGEIFSFSNQAINDANIVTFGRAKCRLTNEPVISFDLSFGEYDVMIEIDRKGLLSRPFGPGFFDESGNLVLDIIKNHPNYN